MGLPVQAQSRGVDSSCSVSLIRSFAESSSFLGNDACNGYLAHPFPNCQLSLLYLYFSLARSSIEGEGRKCSSRCSREKVSIIGEKLALPCRMRSGKLCRCRARGLPRNLHKRRGPLGIPRLSPGASTSFTLFRQPFGSHGAAQPRSECALMFPLTRSTPNWNQPSNLPIYSRRLVHLDKLDF